MCEHCETKDTKKKKRYLTEYEELMKEYDWEANEGLDPSKLTHGMDKKIGWICPLGHKYKAGIYNRTKRHQGCPYCKRISSIQEYAIKFYLGQLGFKIEQSYRKFGFELDLYIPELNIAVEYDGGFWHKNRIQKDLNKNKQCKKLGITLYRIRENLELLNDSSIDIYYDLYKESLDKPIKTLLSYISPKHTIEVNFNRDKDLFYLERNKDLTIKIKAIKYHKIGDVIKEQWKIIKTYSDVEIHGKTTYGLYDAQCIKCGYIKYMTHLSNLTKTKTCRHCSKSIILDGKRFDKVKLSNLLGYNKRYVTYLINKLGYDNALKRITKLYEEKQKNGFSEVKDNRVKYIKINNVTKSYRELSKWLGKSRNYVSELIRYHGIQEATKRLTKMYLEKQKQESIKKDNIAA